MSCLFDSLSKSVNLDSKLLRKAIMTYISTNPSLIDGVKASEIIDWEKGINLNSYVNKMSRNNEWGGQIEIKAFCDLFNMDVTVHVLYTNKEFVTNSCNKATHNVHITYNGSHFEFLKCEK